VGYIEGWYVAPDLRGMGIGRRLVQAAEDWARSNGCREMASDCTLDNDLSLRAHLALGYEETERLVHFRKVL
jgi:aminoglycoside 6'-N-acetyltransferase I